MPIYVYRCLRCGDEIEEYRSIKAYDDPPPSVPEMMCPETIVFVLDDAGKPKLDADGNTTVIDDTAAPCDYQRAMTTASFSWPHGTESNEGRHGWEKAPGGMMIRRTAGKEATKYGEGA